MCQHSICRASELLENYQLISGDVLAFHNLTGTYESGKKRSERTFLRIQNYVNPPTTYIVDTYIVDKVNSNYCQCLYIVNGKSLMWLYTMTNSQYRLKYLGM